MIKELDEKILERLKNGTQAERIYLCGEEFVYFALYYFDQFFTYKIPMFHYRMYQDLSNLIKGEFDYLMWIMFRESAKTTIAKIFVTWCICYNRFRFINFDSYDKDNAEESIFDVANWLMSNEDIIQDFGHLYIEPRTFEKKTMKRLNEFITTNRIKVKAYSTQESTRGRIFDRFRPDFFIVDDFETTKTKTSMAVTQKIGDHIDEMKAGLGPGAKVLFLGNLITEAGNVYRLMKAAEEDPRFKVRQVDVVMDSKIKWPDKYVLTDEEAFEMNKNLSRDEQKVSLESKKRSLNAGGKRIYEVEMMNDPAAAGDIIFDRVKVDEALARIKPPIEELAGFRVWDRYNPKHRYAGGADTSKGVGRDHNASVFIDFSPVPARVVGTYKNNVIAPDIFAFELKRQGNIFGTCLLAPEINNTGYATITQLKQIYPLKWIYQQVPKDKLIDKPSANPTLGFEATRATRPEIIYQLKSAFEDGMLEVFEEAVLLEMRGYTQADLEDYSEKTTRHFDLLTACAIAWAMRDYAKVADSQKKQWRQAPWEPTHPYQGK